MKWLWLTFCLICVLPICYSYDNVYEFDMNELMIISTTVYNTTGKPCITCSCNLTVYYPYPDQNTIFTSRILDNNGQGIFSINLGNNLTYNKYIYPIQLVCNDTSGFFGGDDRVGIKVGESLFDYSSVMMILFGIGVALLFASFFIDKKMFEFRTFAFFSSFIFFIGGMFMALKIVQSSPIAEQLGPVLDVMFYVILAVLLVFVFLFARRRFIATVEQKNNQI